MERESLKFLTDILLAIELIEKFTSDCKTFKEYEKDRKTQNAVERQLVIVGEALVHLKRVAPKFEIENYRQIISFRNRLVHAYDNIDNSIVWAILKRHLQPLKTQVVHLISQ